MIIEIKVPSPGESVTEVEISRWLVPDGSQVTKGQEIAEVESDKATLTIVADVSGKLSVVAKEGLTVPVGSVAAVIDTEAVGAQGTEHGTKSLEHGAKGMEHGAKSMEHGAKGMEHGAKGMEHGAKSMEQGALSMEHGAKSMEHGARGMEHGAKGMEHGALSMEHGAKSMEHGARGMEHGAKSMEHRAKSIEHGAWSMEHGAKSKEQGEPVQLKISAVAREMMKEHQLSVDELIAGLKRIGKKEVEEVLALRKNEILTDNLSVSPSREVTTERMTVLRRKLSERLVSVKNETAMLTTFNEVDMSAVMVLRTRFQQKFTEKHGLKLGFMAFFAKAAAIAAQYHPSVNSMLSGEDILSPKYVDIGIAVQTPKGLMVPVVRNAESKSVPEIEKEIRDLAEKARTKKITIEELSGGTFTITNGGVFGSLLSTPILNPPQSAILGMHNIVERPVAVEGKVEIRPMMYIALSYDHRVIDGKDSVGFLVKVKEMIENPQKMFAQGKDPVELLLEI